MLSQGERGFTLVETLVSLVILTVALIPILNLSTDIARVNSNIQDSMVASGLAQEGIEVIRAIRDTNWFRDLSFDSGLGDGVYEVEWDSVAPLSPSLNQFLNISSGRYTYSTGSATKFKRTVTITKLNAGELKIVSQITWLAHADDSRSISVEDHLFNWK